MNHISLEKELKLYHSLTVICMVMLTGMLCNHVAVTRNHCTMPVHTTRAIYPILTDIIPIGIGYASIGDILMIGAFLWFVVVVVRYFRDDTPSGCEVLYGKYIEEYLNNRKVYKP